MTLRAGAARAARQPPRTVLFDLDGTLLDTAPDMAEALNEVLIAEGRRPLPLAQIRPMVSHGSAGLLRLGFGVDTDDPAFAALRERFLASYRARLTDRTRPFPGIDAVLEGLRARGLAWGVVTNKPGWLTEPLLEATGLHAAAACVVSGDSTDQRKPHPKPLLHACRLVGCPAGACAYVGDAERDVQAGQAAGLHTLVALYGYIDPSEDRPEDWGADTLLDSPAALIVWLDSAWPRRA